MSVRVGFVGSIGGSLLLSSALLTAPAYAESKASVPAASVPAAPPASAPAAPSAPDVVRLKNGGMLRGTIAESKPGEFVTILLITGESRKVSAADIAYAGPADAAPGAAPAAPLAPAPAPAPAPGEAPAPAPNAGEGHRPFVTVEGPEAKVQFESSPQTITLHRRSASAGLAGHGALISGYDEICTAPCRVSLPAGTYTFAASRPGHNAVEAIPVTLPAGASVLHADYTDNSGTRVLGVVLIVASVTAGLALEYDGLTSGPQTCDEFNICSRSADTTEIAIGGVAAVAGGTLGFVLAYSPDKVVFTVGAGAGAPPSVLRHVPRGGELASSGQAERGLAGLHFGLAF